MKLRQAQRGCELARGSNHGRFLNDQDHTVGTRLDGFWQFHLEGLVLRNFGYSFDCDH